MPDILFSSAEDLPEELRPFAKETDGGKIVINLVPNDRLKEFRDNNVKIVQERDDLKSRVTGYETVLPNFDPTKTPAELAELRAIAKRVKDGELTESKAIEEALQDRTKELRKSLEDQLAARGKALSDAEKARQLAEAKIKQQAVKIAMRDAINDPKAGVVPSAVDDIVQRALTTFAVDDDEKLVPKQGGAVLYGSDGVTPMTPLEWLGTLKDTSPHLFKQSNGGGNGVGEQKFNGFSKSEIEKMSPEQKLAMANEASKPKGYA